MQDTVKEKLEDFWKENPKGIAWPPRENYYEHYVLWASLVKPVRYLEIGVMYGWSAMAILAGYPYVGEIVLIDNELYEIPITYARDKILEFREKVGINHPLSIRIVKEDSKKMPRLPVKGTFDLMHVDGEHSEAAAKHDLELCLPHLSERGTIIVDDINFEEVKNGADAFLKEHSEVTKLYVPTCQGHYLIRRR